MFLRITIGAVLAFGMEVSEFMVLSQTSSLTLSVTGVLKEICQLVLAVETKGDQLSGVNVLGLVMCLAGIACHVAHKYSVFKSGGEGDGATNRVATISPDDDGLGPDGEDDGGGDSSSFQFRYRNKSSVGGKLLDQSPLLDTDEEEDVELFKAGGGGGKAGGSGKSRPPLKMDKESADDIIFDIVQRRDQRR